MSHIYGLDKTDHHVLNSINLDGSRTVAYAGGNERHLLQQIFVAAKEFSQMGVKFAKNAIMDLELYAVCQHILNKEKNKYNIVAATTVSDQYAWHEMLVHSSTGERILITGVREWVPNHVFFIDWATWDLHTNGGITPVYSLGDGIQFHIDREERGISYIADFECFGQLVCNYPLANAALVNIPTSVRLTL